jgi:hypothetical protein
MTADTPAPDQPTCVDLYDEARTRPKSVRLLPSIARDAVRLVWAAAPRELTISIALKLGSALSSRAGACTSLSPATDFAWAAFHPETRLIS